MPQRPMLSAGSFSCSVCAAGVEVKRRGQRLCDDVPGRHAEHVVEQRTGAVVAAGVQLDQAFVHAVVQRQRVQSARRRVGRACGVEAAGEHQHPAFPGVQGRAGRERQGAPHLRQRLGPGPVVAEGDGGEQAVRLGLLRGAQRRAVQRPLRGLAGGRHGAGRGQGGQPDAGDERRRLQQQRRTQPVRCGQRLVSQFHRAAVGFQRALAERGAAEVDGVGRGPRVAGADVELVAAHREQELQPRRVAFTGVVLRQLLAQPARLDAHD
jgi:hypothetical protein